MHHKNDKTEPNHSKLISELLEYPLLDSALSYLHKAILAIDAFYTSNEEKNTAIEVLEEEANRIGATVLWHFDAISHYTLAAQKTISDCMGEYISKSMTLKKMEIERNEEQIKE